MKTVIIYKTTTGFTLRYAKWIQEEFPCDLVSFQDENKVELINYDTIIFASSLHAGKIKGISWLKNKLKSIKDKHIILLTTGAMPNVKDNIEKIFNENINEEERKFLSMFYVESGLNYEKMGMVDKGMMFGLKKFLKKTEGVDSPIYTAILKSYDHSSKDKLEPLFTHLKEINE